MKSHFLPLLVLAAIPAAAGSLQAQDNVYPITFVDATGTALPVGVDAVTGHVAAASATESVYLAFHPDTPSGDYYVHVTDVLNGNLDRVLSLNNPLDRFVTVTNLGGGVILISVPNNPTLVMGAGLGGLGDSLPLGLFAENPEHHCFHKAWIGDTFNMPVNPTWPYTVLTGGVRSFAYFRIGDGSGSSISGVVFDDLDGNGTQDPGEAGLAGVTVELTGPNGLTSVVSAADGSYSFTGLVGGSYTVTQIVDPQSGRVATTATSFTRDAMGCGIVEGGDFGQNLVNTNCDGHTIGYWGNRHGLALVESHGLLALLPGLNVVDASGAYFTTSDLNAYKTWLRGAKATNMAYMLSAQLVAMRFNVAVGFVGGTCEVNDANLGVISINDLMDAAIASLATDPYTPTGHAQRAYQEQLKNALDGANNNSNWN
jgi:hypothetical protein